MSVEKLSGASKLIQEQKPFTQVLNEVIYNIKDGDSFRVWCYLQSKTENWKVVKQNIKNMYGFGDKKIKKIFSYLHRSNLIKYVQTRSANGDFAQVDIRVLSGFEFDKTQAYTECARGGAEMGRAINGTTANDELLNKDITKERKEHNKESNSATDVAQVRANDDSFENYWKINPVKKNRIRAKKIWDKKKLYKIETVICADILNRLEHDPQWQDRQYIPHPSTYLFNELWNDEITPSSATPKKSGGKSSSFDAYQAELQKQNNTRGTTYEHGAIPRQ